MEGEQIPQYVIPESFSSVGSRTRTCIARTSSAVVVLDGCPTLPRVGRTKIVLFPQVY